MDCPIRVDAARFIERAKIELVRSSHAVGEANFHVVLVPAYRRPIFADARVRELTLKYIKEKLAQYHIVLVLAEFGSDHLHMFWANVVEIGVRRAFALVKGYSSRRMRERHLPLFRKWLWGKKFWTSGKFYRSIGAINTERALRYMAAADERHFSPMPLGEWVEAKQTRLEEFSLFHSREFPAL